MTNGGIIYCYVNARGSSHCWLPQLLALGLPEARFPNPPHAHLGKERFWQNCTPLLIQTIIEVLKYITTGALPPSCDKGKNFLMDPKLINESELTAETRLKFKAFNGRPVLAKRRALISVSTKGVKFESVEQTLKTKDENGELFEINHQCAEIEKQIPQLLGISKAVL